jgi:phosphatidylglycerol:prolipoprotein diacylglycerol transferase
VKLSSTHVEENLRGIAIHPVQLYESGLLFILSLLLFWRWHKRSFPGEIFLLYFAIYPIIRGVTEMYRGDSIRGFVIEGVLSTSQFISILIFLVAAISYVAIRRKQSR